MSFSRKMKENASKSASYAQQALSSVSGLFKQAKAFTQAQPTSSALFVASLTLLNEMSAANAEKMVGEGVFLYENATGIHYGISFENKYFRSSSIVKAVSAACMKVAVSLKQPDGIHYYPEDEPLCVSEHITGPSLYFWVEAGKHVSAAMNTCFKHNAMNKICDDVYGKSEENSSLSPLAIFGIAASAAVVLYGAYACIKGIRDEAKRTNQSELQESLVGVTVVSSDDEKKGARP